MTICEDGQLLCHQIEWQIILKIRAESASLAQKDSKRGHSESRESRARDWCRRQLKQRYFKEFKTLQEVENYIAELNIGIPETNKYGNTTEVIGTRIFKEGK